MDIHEHLLIVLVNYSRMFLNNKWDVQEIHKLSAWSSRALFMKLRLPMNDQEPEPETLTKFTN